MSVVEAHRLIRVAYLVVHSGAELAVHAGSLHENNDAQVHSLASLSDTLRAAADEIDAVLADRRGNGDGP